MPKTIVAQCPRCRTDGKKVSAVTLNALVKDEIRERIAADTEYSFCDAKGCDVVYFTASAETITTVQLAVAIGVKLASGERPLCYCFGHSVASIKDEIRAKGRSDALDDIRQKMKDPGCACESKNPSGACCLGVVGKGIETAMVELKGATPRNVRRAETISKVGTAMSAVMASACCWLPLLLLAFGVSGAGVAGALDAYRPLFIVVTIGFLAAAFYFTYRPQKNAPASESCCAAVNDCCSAPTTGRRWKVMAMNRVMLWGVTLFAVAFLFFPSYMRFFLTGGNVEPTTSNPLVRTTTLSVQGMTSEGCSALVERAIRGVPGVLSVKVDYEQKRVVITSETCCQDPTVAAVAALDAAGYRAAAGEAEAKRTNTVNAVPMDTDREIVFAVRGFT